MVNRSFAPTFLMLIAMVAIGLASLVSSGAEASAMPTVPARAARALSVHDTASLRLVSHQGTQILNERGVASGTLRGSLAIAIHLAYTSAAVTFTAYPSGGSLSGGGTEAYYVAGHTGYFKGTMRITHGTGRYAHASGSLHITGKIVRRSYAVSVEIIGQLRY